MPLSKAQQELIEKLGSNIENGLTTDQAAAQREAHGFNVLRPPIDCPAFLCVILPCIQFFPSMKAFRAIQPDDAEVKRNGRWIRYDASSLVKGDIVRLAEGDIVPADCICLQVENNEEVLVDHRLVTAEDKPRATTTRDDGTTKPTQLLAGARVAQGKVMVIVTATGDSTLVASLMREGRFPPQQSVVRYEDDEQGILLATRNQMT